MTFFACGELGLFEALPLLCLLPEQAVLASRPYIRPLLEAVQRCPDYRVAIADREHARVLSVSGSRVETVATQAELRCENDLAVVPGAAHLFEEPGALDAAAGLARDWFLGHLPHGPP